MSACVHILATVRRRELLPAALLVFQTLRTGFPRAEVFVWGNNLDPKSRAAVEGATKAVGGHYAQLNRTAHDEWIEHMMLNWRGEFWLCDTDVVFFESLEAAPAGEAEVEMMGRLEPGFNEEWTGTFHVERLHTCLLYINPARVRARMRVWQGQFNGELFGNAQAPLIRWTFVPQRGKRPLFYDTCAGLWQAGIGTAFSEAQNRAFEHLHCATYADLVAQCEGLADLPKVHAAIYEEPLRARGLWEQQQAYYSERK